MKLQARIDRMVQKGNVKAIASVSLDGMFVVKGLKVMDGKKGLFVSMPQESFPGKDGQKQYSNTFFALTNSAKMQLQEVVLDAYKLSLDPNYVPKQSQGQHDYPQHIQHQRDYYGGQYHQQYPEPGYPDHQFGESEYPDFLVDSDDMLPMGLY